MKIPILDLGQQYKIIKKDMFSALAKTMQRGDFILGEEERLFEKEFAKFCNRNFAVGVNSGTDALFLSLLSLGVGKGDEVIVPAFTYIASAFAVSFTGAKPVFVDIREDTYNIDVEKIERAITKNTKAIMPVHLYGQPADMKPICKIAKKHNLKVVEDCAQAHGAKYKISKNNWQIAGSIGDVGCFSFYPTKNLGAFGDGGMIVTDDENIHKKLLMLRDYGRKSRYKHVMLGYNSRLDTIQAALLRIKLRYLNIWNKARRNNASIYQRELKDIDGTVLPYEADYSYHVYHCFAARVKNRDKVINELTKEGIGVLIHYPIPLHLQKVYKNLGYRRGDFPVSERIAKEIISLPMYPHLKENQIKFIAETLKKIL
jgi:dTDP-4-amino-4,6-dideoxygalactose transaminase